MSEDPFDKMSNYILVHGGNRDGRIWEHVCELLRLQGHNVHCPSMTSIEISDLTKNIDEIVSEIKSKALDEIILCGHSYGAMVIAGVYDVISFRIRQLVFIDSVIPKNGMSLHELLNEAGFNYKDFRLTPDPACLEKLFFREDYLSSANKSYIRCLKGSFNKITEFFAKNLNDEWLYFCLDTEHDCMKTKPKELSIILNGLSFG